MTRTEIIHAIAEHEAVGEDHDELDGRLAYLDGAYFTWGAPSEEHRGGEKPRGRASDPAPPG
jgi:hypothetical protein